MITNQVQLWSVFLLVRVLALRSADFSPLTDLISPETTQQLRYVFAQVAQKFVQEWLQVVAGPRGADLHGGEQLYGPLRTGRPPGSRGPSFNFGCSALHMWIYHKGRFKISVVETFNSRADCV